ncbi:uncharacterized protein LOC114525836 [Dendronephthya gigantea]|uniref:uncharacterized protein LOC114525836 n=1 Tax=Dendronephthya gigantea TaxID=151771 RepID=UPI00106C6135|nr:uncharacterized protein LOC114525836 [Dendronephthya gigantea]
MNGDEGDGNEPLVENQDNNNEDESRLLYRSELTFFRLTLRLLSLWHPRDAWFVEKSLYPLVVNVLLLLLIAADVFMLKNGNWTSLEIYVYIVIDIGMYLSHSFGFFYFKSRDLEHNMLKIVYDRQDQESDETEEFKRKLKRLKLLVIFTFSTLSVLILLFFNVNAWLHGRFHCNSVFTFIKGAPNHIVCILNYPANIYGIGNSLAISWTICLLQQACFVRLNQLARKYQTWRGNTESAIYDHIVNYSRKDITENNPIHSGLFLGYLIYTIVVWISPLYFAELLQRHDENFCTTVNEFCPGIFRELEPELYAEFINPRNEGEPVVYVFHSRGEVNKFLSYLMHRKSGFLIGSYSFQFKLSMVSITLAMIAFATRIIA